MKCVRLLPVLLLIAAAPAITPVTAPISAPLRDRLIADAGALPPEKLAFDRSTHGVRAGGGTSTASKIADRWSGKTWRLVATHGRPPSATERADHKRLAGAIPVPGYYQLGAIIAAATTSGTDAQGRTLLYIPAMPVDSVRTDTGDISNHLQGEVRLARRGDAVWVDQLRVTARAQFKLNMLIKVTGFEQTSEYAPGPGGRPQLITQKSESTGTMFGFPGGEKSAASFVYR